MMMSAKRTVGIVYKHNNKAAIQESLKLRDWFEKQGVETFTEGLGEPGSNRECREESSSIPEKANWVIVLGGDGTLLGAARRVRKYGIPILGVNLGGMGFLTGVPSKNLYAAAEMMLQGTLEVESRVMLETRVIRSSEEVCRFQVLNDMVINKHTLARIIDMEVTIDDEFLTAFRADGLIVSSPTGSTAYNLSAGGPILYPTMETFVITPICPFTLTNRPIIIPDTSLIKIRIGHGSDEKVVLTFDGQVGFDLYNDDIVITGKSEEKIKLFRPPEHSYFEILRTKLMWGGSTCNKS